VRVYEELGTLVFLLVFVSNLTLLQVHASIAYTNIDVETAYGMITSGSYPNLVVLDVRTEWEFLSGHLQAAILISHDELEQKIGDLTGHENHEIIVYCKAGSRSTIACDILVAHSFTRVFKMTGGIMAWIEKGYPIVMGSVPANVDIKPDTLNMKSRGRWITAYLELPKGYDVRTIDVSSILCYYGVCPCGGVHADLRPVNVGDYDNDRIPDLMVKFDRAAIIASLWVGNAVLTVNGVTGGKTPFGGVDTVIVIGG